MYENKKTTQDQQVDLKLGLKIQDAINRSFTKSKQDINQEQKAEDWKLLKENSNLAEAVLKTWHNESLQHIQENSHLEAYAELSHEDLKNLKNEKINLEGYQEVLADLKDTKKSQLKELEQDKKQSWLKQQLKKLNINPKELSVEREKGEYTL